MKFREVSPKVGCSSLRASPSSQHLPTLTFSKTAAPANVLAYVMREGFWTQTSLSAVYAIMPPSVARPSSHPPPHERKKRKRMLRSFLNSADLYVGPSFRTLRLLFHLFIF